MHAVWTNTQFSWIAATGIPPSRKNNNMVPAGSSKRRSIVSMIPARNAVCSMIPITPIATPASKGEVTHPFAAHTSKYGCAYCVKNTKDASSRIPENTAG